MSHSIQHSIKTALLHIHIEITQLHINHSTQQTDRKIRQRIKVKARKKRNGCFPTLARTFYIFVYVCITEYVPCCCLKVSPIEKKYCVYCYRMFAFIIVLVKSYGWCCYCVRIPVGTCSQCVDLGFFLEIVVVVAAARWKHIYYPHWKHCCADTAEPHETRPILILGAFRE